MSWDVRCPQPAHMQTHPTWPVSGQQGYPPYSGGNIGQGGQTELSRTSPNSFLPPPPPLVRYSPVTPPNQTIGPPGPVLQQMYRPEPSLGPSVSPQPQIFDQPYLPSHSQLPAQQVPQQSAGLPISSSGSSFSNGPQPAHQQQPQTAHMPHVHQPGLIRAGFPQGMGVNTVQQNPRPPIPVQQNPRPPIPVQQNPGLPISQANKTPSSMYTSQTASSQFQQTPQQLMGTDQRNQLLHQQQQQKQIHQQQRFQTPQMQQQRFQTQQQQQQRYPTPQQLQRLLTPQQQQQQQRFQTQQQQQQRFQTQQQQRFQTPQQQQGFQTQQHHMQQRFQTPQQQQQGFQTPQQQQQGFQTQQQNQQQRFQTPQQQQQRFQIPQQRMMSAQMQQQQQQQQHLRPSNMLNHHSMGTNMSHGIQQKHIFSNPGPSQVPNYTQNPVSQRPPISQPAPAVQRGPPPACQITEQGPLPPPPPYQPRPSVPSQHTTNARQMTGQPPDLFRYPQPAHSNNPSLQTRPAHTVSSGSIFDHYGNIKNVNQVASHPTPATSSQVRQPTTNLDEQMTMKVLRDFAMAQIRKDRLQKQQQISQNHPSQSNPDKLPTQHSSQDDSSLIRSAFKLTKSSKPDPTPNDVAVLGRWYAQPSSCSDSELAAVQPPVSDVTLTSQPTSAAASGPQMTHTTPTTPVAPPLSPHNVPFIDPVTLTNGVQRLLPDMDSAVPTSQSTHCRQTDCITSPSITSTVRSDTISVPSTTTGSEMSSDYYRKPSIETEESIEYSVKDMLQYQNTLSPKYQEKIALMESAEAFINGSQLANVLDKGSENSETKQTTLNTENRQEMISINSDYHPNKDITSHILKEVSSNNDHGKEGVQTKGANLSGRSETGARIVDESRDSSSDTYKVDETKTVDRTIGVTSGVFGVEEDQEEFKLDMQLIGPQSSSYSDLHMFIPEGGFLQETTKRVTEELLQMDKQFEENNFDPSISLDLFEPMHDKQQISSPLEIESEKVPTSTSIELTLELQKGSSTEQENITLLSVPVSSSIKADQADNLDSEMKLPISHEPPVDVDTVKKHNSPSILKESDEQQRVTIDPISAEQAKLLKALQIASRYTALPDQDELPDIEKTEPHVELDIAEPGYMDVEDSFPQSIHPFSHDMYGYGYNENETHTNNADGMNSRGSSGKKRKRDSTDLGYDGDGQSGNKKSRGTARRGKRGSSRGRGKPGPSGVSRKLDHNSATLAAGEDVEDMVTQPAEDVSRNKAIRGAKRGRGRSFRGQKNQGLAVSMKKTGRGRGKRGRGRGRGKAVRNISQTLPQNSDISCFSDASDTEEMAPSIINNGPGDSQSVNTAYVMSRSPGKSKSSPEESLSPGKQKGQDTISKNLTLTKSKSLSPKGKDIAKSKKLKHKQNHSNENKSFSDQTNNENVLEITIERQLSTDNSESAPNLPGSTTEEAVACVVNEGSSLVNVPVETIVLSDLYQVTWVRFHGKVTTRLITPSGNLFLVKEIFRRCFRIQAEGKRNQVVRIQGIMKSVLKIQEMELDPVLVPFVIKSLKERKVIKTIPDMFTTITENDANALFHYVYADKFCDEGCVTVFYKDASTTSVSLDTSETGAQTCVKTAQAGVDTINSDIKTNDDGKSQSTVTEKASASSGKNIFEIIEASNHTLQKSKKGTKSGKTSTSNTIEGFHLKDMVKHIDDNGYDTDSTLPYVDGTPQQNLAEIETEIEPNKAEEKHKTTSVEAGKNKEVISVRVTNQDTVKDKSAQSKEDIDIVVLDSDADSDEEIERTKCVDKNNGNKSKPKCDKNKDSEKEIKEKRCEKSTNSNNQNSAKSSIKTIVPVKEYENFVEITIHDDGEEEVVNDCPDLIPKIVSNSLALKEHDDGDQAVLGGKEKSTAILIGEDKNVALLDGKEKETTMPVSEDKEVAIIESEKMDTSITDKFNNESLLDGEKMDTSIVIEENSVTTLNSEEKDNTIVDSEDKDVIILKESEEESDKSSKLDSENVLNEKSPTGNSGLGIDDKNIKLMRSLEKIKKFIYDTKKVHKSAKRKLPEINSNDVIVIDNEDNEANSINDKSETAKTTENTPLSDSDHGKIFQGSSSSETLSEKSSDGEIDIEAQGRSGSCRENPFVSSCNMKDLDIMAFEKKIRQCIDKANKTEDAEELADVCSEVMGFTKPLEDLSRKYLSEGHDDFAIAQGNIMEVERCKLMKELSMAGDPIFIDLELTETESPQVIEVDPTENDNGT